MATDKDRLSIDVSEQINEPDAQLCISTETVRELIVAYHNKGFDTRRWKTAEEMVKAIEDVFYITILPLQKEHSKRMLSFDLMSKMDIKTHLIM